MSSSSSSSTCGSISEENNSCSIQGFEWYVPADGNHWKRLKGALPQLKDVGIDSIWLPPACKGAEGTKANGYDIYDLYDLGEFDQKGGTSTKWGSKQELMELSEDAAELGVALYFDAVISHKTGADRTKVQSLQEVEFNDRTKCVGEPWTAEVWTEFDFPGRENKYSSFKWKSEHFNGCDYDNLSEKRGIFRFADKAWSRYVAGQWVNADFLMFSNIDYEHPEVVKEMIDWATWITQKLKLGGFRLDACKHISHRFTNELITTLEQRFPVSPLKWMGDYWTKDVNLILEYLKHMERPSQIYDSPLMYNFARLSTGAETDLRTVFDNTLVQRLPEAAVTFVGNHDTQKGQTLETTMEAFFKPLAYSLILLRKDGDPCLFYGDLYGIQGPYPEPPACKGKLPDMTLARQLYAYGDQKDYWHDSECLGFMRRGTGDHPHGLACVMSIGVSKQVEMHVGKEHAGETWTDVLEWHDSSVTITESGMGSFPCLERSVSVWVQRDAPGRYRFGQFDADIYGR